jgi:hypothetical protein
MKRFVLLAVMAVAAKVANANPASSKPVSPELRYALVGVISASDGQGKNLGMAVIKDVANGRSMNIRTGQQLPNGEGLWVSAIGRAEVTVTDGVNKHSISYGVPTPSRSTLAEYRTDDSDDANGYDYETLTGDEEIYSSYSYDATSSTRAEGADSASQSTTATEPVRSTSADGSTSGMSVDRPSSDGIRDYAEQNAGKPEVVDRVLDMYREYADGVRASGEDSNRESRVNHYDERRDVISEPSEENE